MEKGSERRKVGMTLESGLKLVCTFKGVTLVDVHLGLLDEVSADW